MSEHTAHSQPEGASGRTEAINACIALADDRATCADALCARKGECQYPSDCPYDNPLAANARAELTALEAEVARKDAEIARLTAALEAEQRNFAAYQEGVSGGNRVQMCGGGGTPEAWREVGVFTRTLIQKGPQ